MKIVLSALILFLLAAPAAAERMPATFDHPERALATLIAFPELRGEVDRRVRCAARVDRKGKFGETGCYVDTAGDETYLKAIVAATKKARMNPATIDGKPVEVYVQFQVHFRQAGEERSITLLNNPGLTENIEAYGDAHIAAQRALTKESWNKVCPRRTRYIVWAKAHVAETGEQSSISIVPGSGAPITDACRAAIVATLEESRFTPALADGEPVPSSFIEPFGN